MRTCPYCESVTFDDMDTCYGCLHQFGQAESGSAGGAVDGISEARLQVVLSGVFVYETFLRKTEGALLSVGCAQNNTIVIPQASVASHHLDIFFSQGQIWAECLDVPQQTGMDGMPLYGIRSINSGNCITIGDATITVVSE